MPKQVVFDTVEIDYARVDVRDGEVRVMVHYAVKASATGETLWRDADVSHLLTDDQRQTIIQMAQMLQQALTQQEFGNA